MPPSGLALSLCERLSRGADALRVAAGRNLTCCAGESMANASWATWGSTWHWPASHETTRSASILARRNSSGRPLARNLSALTWLSTLQ
eukprot:6235697-Pyramimonas_sp.AAC.1